MTRARIPRPALARALLGAAAAVLAAVATGAQSKNVILIVADDLGVDGLAAYGVGSDLPNTPTLDSMAQTGVVFRNCWANPVCAPTRATLQTGRYALRTGIGNILNGNLGEYGLQLDELLLPEMLQLGPNSYDQALFGKWHLGSENVGGLGAPNLAGYSHFAGTIGNIDDYYDWEKVKNGIATPTTTYATTVSVNDALGWLATAEEPWFLQIAFNAPHYPFHAPPPALHTVDLSMAGNPEQNPRPFYKAMVEAVDTEMGRLFAGLGPDLADTTVIFVGDNGTPMPVVQPPVPTGHAKGTLFDASLNVPLIVTGPFVQVPGVTEALVNTTDVFATVADIAGIDLATALPPSTKLDSTSFLPHIADPSLPSTRGVIFAEKFGPNGPTAGLPVPLPPDPASHCQVDLGFGGPGSATLSACGGVLAEGNEIPLVLSGAPASRPGFLFFFTRGDQGPRPGVFLGGNALALSVQVVVGISTDAAGQFSLPSIIGPRATTVVAQAAIQDPAGPSGWALSNLLELELLPGNSKAARDERYKLIWSINGGPQQLYDLLNDPFELDDLLVDGSLTPDEEARRLALETAIEDLIASY